MKQSDFDAIVVGAGFSGLYMLYKLRELGLSAKVIEAGSDVGGTWYWNRYPGARCDCESKEYSFSFSPELEQEWDWSERYSAQPEILAYLQHVADRFDLRRDISFGTRVTAAHWDDGEALWTVETDAGDSYTARYCIMGTGCLSSANRPDIPGLDDFAGETYLTGLWPHDGVEFAGKRVAVIGTGSSAIQAIPLIAREAASVTVFQRTPNFAIPAHNYPLSAEEIAEFKADYRNIRKAERESNNGLDMRVRGPTSAALEISEEQRNADFERLWGKEEGGLWFFASHTDTVVNLDAAELAGEFVRNKIRQQVKDPEVAELLCPKSFPLGSKRLCVDTDYYATYNLPHVRLIDLKSTPIERIEAAGVRTSEELVEADIIVLATGFDAMTGALARIDIRGSGGLPLKEKWAAGPVNFLGLMSAGFPNLFTVTGPGSPSVLSNMVASIEQHVEWIADTLAELERRGARTIEALPETEQAWVEHVNQVAEPTIFMHSNSWYLGANIPGKPRIFMPYIGGCHTYRRICDHVAENGFPGFAIDGEARRDAIDFFAFLRGPAEPEMA